MEEVMRPLHPPPWYRQLSVWLSIIAVIVSLLALFRDYLGWQYGVPVPSKAETKPAAPAATPPTQ
jgi:hypothetical protein